jgi:hypothetical protein
MDTENNKRLQDLLSDKSLEYVTECARALSSIGDTLTMMGLELDDQLRYTLMMEPKFTKAYNIGKLQSEYDIRAAVVKLAVNGSAPAQIEAVKLIDKLRIENA